MYSFSGIYITSKIRHASKWRKLADEGIPLTCSWIWMDLDPNNPDEMAWAWGQQMIEDCRRTKVLIIYLEEGEQLKGGLIEIGAVLASGGKIFSVGVMPDLVEGNRDFAEAITHFDDMEAAIRAALEAISPERSANQ